jgi:hypothetical protein
MGPDLIEFTITLYLQADNEFYYTSESDRGDAELYGTYVLNGGTLRLHDSDRGLLDGKDYVYVEGTTSTISGEWYLGDAPDPVFKPTTLTKE